ncbi:MAG: hypothetical protein MZV70_35755 [Desulfobacterales bacterium]|nr:hypothetical protein [Desulfobacterales bacterium]
MRGTDFGYDVLTARADGIRGQVPVTRVYCFEGSVVVTVVPAPDVPAVGAQGQGRRAWSTVEQAEGHWVPSLVPVSEDIRSFWTQNDFAAVRQALGRDRPAHLCAGTGQPQGQECRHLRRRRARGARLRAPGGREPTRTPPGIPFSGSTPWPGGHS